MALNNRRIEGSFSQGWPIAIFITALAVGSFVTAGLIHKRIFREPTDVMADYRKEGGAEHKPDSGSQKSTAH
jgi:hypothetical protein